jgi:serine/threonine-protein kinase
MIGQTIAHYKVTAKLGAGGMGEVYRATDTKLGRDVALKVLPERFAQDAQRMARFEREAQVLASLNHPNIAAIHGLEEGEGMRALVMELVEGPTLAERIAQGPIPLEETLPIAKQIAEGLEYAHEHGVIHRDLKPSNIKVTPEGTVKVLDFGLAKALEGETPATDLSHSPTLTAMGTQAGVILGTAPYMSPEQARGKPVDKRADIWAFGCVLYEVMTGKRAFSGETVSDVLAGVLKSDPDWSTLPAETPPKIRALLHHCLVKDPKHRLHDIADARIEIDETLTQPMEVPPAVFQRLTPWRRRLPWAVAALLMGGVLLLLWRLNFLAPSSAEKLVRFSIHLAPTDRLSFNFPALAISPDGTRLAIVAQRGETTQLYLRRLDQLEAIPIAGSEDASIPFFSPDGQWVAFTAGNKLKKVSVSGGSPLVICDTDWGGGSWGPDGYIIFTASYAMGLWRVSAAGGSPEMLTTPDHSKGELGHWWPQILPGGKAVLFTIFSTPIEKARIVVQSVKPGAPRTLIEGASFARYVPTGHIVYVRGGTLLAAPFDLDRLEVTGPPVPVLEDMPFYLSNGNSQFSFSEDGTLVYAPASSLRSESMLAWVDRRGGMTRVTDSRRRYSEPRLSPDGQRLAVTVSTESRDIWVYDLSRGTFTRVTSGAASEFGAIWTPDGKRLIFTSEQPVFDLYWKNADGSGPEEPLLTGKYDKELGSVSLDGKLVAFNENSPETRADLWLLPLEGDHKPKLLLRTHFWEGDPQFSPDGRWLAYISDQSGRHEVYVVPFPGAGERIQISTEGGREPVWRHDGRELFYRSGDKVMAVPIQTKPTFRAGRPQVLFRGDYDPGYDVAPDGQRFLMIKTPPESAPRQINVVLNWFEELRRLAPPTRN